MTNPRERDPELTQDATDDTMTHRNVYPTPSTWTAINLPCPQQHALPQTSLHELTPSSATLGTSIGQQSHGVPEAVTLVAGQKRPRSKRNESRAAKNQAPLSDRSKVQRLPGRDQNLKSNIAEVKSAYQVPATSLRQDGMVKTDGQEVLVESFSRSTRGGRPRASPPLDYARLGELCPDVQPNHPSVIPHDIQSRESLHDRELDELFDAIATETTQPISTCSSKELESPQQVHDDFDDFDESLFEKACSFDTLTVDDNISTDAESINSSTPLSSISLCAEQSPRKEAAPTIQMPQSTFYMSPSTMLNKQSYNSGTQTEASQDRKAIVRASFPRPVRDRSAILGISSKTLLRTCFRIGEAIKQASHAVKHGQQVLFELYAKVLASSRDEVYQHFLFGDLFHPKSPRLQGTYHATIWLDVDLYNYDSGRFLNKERMCRCIGVMRREGMEWKLTVLNIWEATWDDIAWVEGIVNA